jgi:hypothetical protein
MRRGFQTIQGGVAPSTEGGMAGLAAKGLDALGLAVLAISYEGMNMSIGDAEVPALLVGTTVPLGCSREWRAPRRLLSSYHGRTGAGACPPADEAVEASQQAGQSSGVRGLSRRCSVVRLAISCEEEGAIREPV